MKHIVHTLLVASFVLLCGCPHNKYEVTLTPHDGAMERTLQFYRYDDESKKDEIFDPKELAAIAAWYPGDGLTQNGERHTAAGEFAGTLPGDVGGSGWHTYLTTSLGSAGFYVERFRGEDDIAGMMLKRFHAADRLADLAIGWINRQFISEPGFEKLHQFLDRDFRQDLKNVSIYGWMAEEMKSGESKDEDSLRFAQYLIEREYVSVEDAPVLIGEWPVDDDETVCLLLQKLIARKMGIPDGQPMPQSLQFVADPEALGDSWKSYLTNTDEYREKLHAWERKKESGPEAKEPDPVSILDDLISALAESGISGGDDRLEVMLSLPVAPINTNGKWDAVNKQVVWKSSLPTRQQLSYQPVFCYTDWVVPQDEFQKTHLGGVSLTGKDLLEYCLWFSLLEEREAREWDQFLTNLRPEPGIVDTVKNFRFSDDSGREKAGKHLVEKAISSESKE